MCKHQEHQTEYMGMWKSQRFAGRALKKYVELQISNDDQVTEDSMMIKG